LRKACAGRFESSQIRESSFHLLGPMKFYLQGRSILRLRSGQVLRPYKENISLCNRFVSERGL
jgi:hypothetical protein